MTPHVSGGGEQVKVGRARPIPRLRDSKGWRKVAAILIVGYCIVAWVLPVIVLVIFRDLPYLHERDFVERFSLSAAGTVALLATMAIAFPERFRIYQGNTAWETAKSAVLGALALTVVTAVAALWSGNIFGTLTKLAPGTEYSARFIVEDADGQRTRRGTALSLIAKDGTGRAHLTLSRMLFGAPQIKAGDELILRGKRNLAGIYVDDFDIAR